VQEVAMVADVVCLLSGGKIVARGTPNQMQSYPSEAVRQFMSGSADGPASFHYPATDYFRELLARSAEF
jgi:phospholipid/cholesterol/gamma-HCH transport system ATP-binding protein